MLEGPTPALSQDRVIISGSNGLERVADTCHTVSTGAQNAIARKPGWSFCLEDETPLEIQFKKNIKRAVEKTVSTERGLEMLHQPLCQQPA